MNSLKPKKRFNTTGWLVDIATGLLTGAAAGCVGAVLVPGPGVLLGTLAGAVTGLVTGLLFNPIKWRLDAFVGKAAVRKKAVPPPPTKSVGNARDETRGIPLQKSGLSGRDNQ